MSTNIVNFRDLRALFTERKNDESMTGLPEPSKSDKMPERILLDPQMVIQTGRQIVNPKSGVVELHHVITPFPKHAADVTTWLSLWRAGYQAAIEKAPHHCQQNSPKSARSLHDDCSYKLIESKRLSHTFCLPCLNPVSSIDGKDLLGGC